MRRFRLHTIISVLTPLNMRNLKSAAHQQPLVLHQHTQIPRAVPAGLGLVDDDRVEQAFPTDLFDHRIREVVQALPEHLSQQLCPLDHVLIADDLERADRDGAAQRVAAVRRAVGAGLDGEHDVPGAEHAGDGVHAAGDGFAEEDEVGLDAAPFVAEELAGARDARLDLVADEEDVVLCA